LGWRLCTSFDHHFDHSDRIWGRSFNPLEHCLLPNGGGSALLVKPGDDLKITWNSTSNAFVMDIIEALEPEVDQPSLRDDCSTQQRGSFVLPPLDAYASYFNQKY
jgi:hypothetical protein